jgi:hypothetical protein
MAIDVTLLSPATGSGEDEPPSFEGSCARSAYVLSPQQRTPPEASRAQLS